MSDPVPAVAEAAATGETAALFADIREVLGVGVVNLIWRHLATIDGALPWAWSTLRPLYLDGAVAAEAGGLRAGLALPALPPLPAGLLPTLGLGEDAVYAIRNVLAAYDRTNAMALVALSALVTSLRDRQEAAGADPGPLPPPPPTRPRLELPPLPALAGLPAETATLVTALNRLGTRRTDPLLASMYRHLGHWPPFLAFAWLLIAPLDADGRLETAIEAARRAAELRAARLVLRLDGARMAPPPAALASAIATAVEPFLADLIARMVVICALLHDATRDPAPLGP